ncbi:MAG: NADH-quinone oxidoreductase subunit C [Actinobacteria bacterium]|nr:NADH-quinone oxidoreductase subunit C [Actinomycetota bacterium]
MKIINYEYKKVDNQDVISAIDKKAKEISVETNFWEFRNQLFCEIASRDIKKFCDILNKDPELSFEYIKCITAVDYIEWLEMIYCLYSFKNNWSINIKVKLDSQKPAVDSVISVYRGADWHEREIAEMFGIDIIGHPNLRPLLLAGDEDGYPLRKNFEIKWEEREYIPPRKFE